jgi:hypothetical protein
MFVKSNTTGVATPLVKVANPGTFVAPVAGPLVRLKIVPLVSPENEPVSKAPAVLTKVGLKLMLEAVTVTLPAIFAIPVIGAAWATFVSNEHDTKPRLSNSEGLNLIFYIVFPPTSQDCIIPE